MWFNFCKNAGYVCVFVWELIKALKKKKERKDTLKLLEAEQFVQGVVLLPIFIFKTPCFFISLNFSLLSKYVTLNICFPYYQTANIKLSCLRLKERNFRWTLNHSLKISFMLKKKKKKASGKLKILREQN